MMGRRDGDCPTSTAEQPPSATTSTKRKFSSHHHQNKRKKQKLITSEFENHTLTLIPNSTTTFTSRKYTHKHSDSNTYTCTSKSYKEQHQSRKTRIKRAKTQDHRQWTYSPRHLSNYKDRIVFVSYNILGVENAAKHSDLYTNISPKFLDWEYRKQLLHKEINDYNPGIICFQEVDRFDDLENILQKDGFRGVYQARTGEASDGCAIFWRKELFTLLHEENIEFQRFGLRNNVAQICIFKMKQSCSDINVNTRKSGAASSRNFLVGNIHVLFNPSRGDIKLGQMRMFLERARALSSEWGSIPVVIAGDLNSMPESAMYQFLASSKLDIRLHDRRKISGQICPVHSSSFQSQNKWAASYYRSSRPFLHRWSEEELWLATGAEREGLLRHDLKLCSAYAGIPANTKTRDNTGEPLATSFHSKFIGTVDYIWHTEELVPVRVLETLPIDVLRKSRGLPSQKWGSDHLALVCELAFADDISGMKNNLVEFEDSISEQLV